MAQTAVEMFTCLSPYYDLLQIFAEISMSCFVPFVVCLGISFFGIHFFWAVEWMGYLATRRPGFGATNNQLNRSLVILKSIIINNEYMQFSP